MKKKEEEKEIFAFENVVVMLGNVNIKGIENPRFLIKLHLK